jgi:hypothetical protein
MPETPCRVCVRLFVRRRFITNPYWIECRTPEAVEHVTKTLIACLRDLDGTVLEEKKGAPDVDPGGMSGGES